MWDYLEKRLNITRCKIDAETFGILDYSDVDNSVSAFFTIDENHYCKVRTYESEYDLMDLLNVLECYKLSIAGNSNT